MTQFNPANKDHLTIGECLDPAMKITDQQDADQYKAAYIEYIEKFLTDGVSETGNTAEEIANSNLGYYAGYGSDEQREKVEKLFKCAHPIFGSIEANGIPSNEKSFALGLAAGAKHKRS